MKQITTKILFLLLASLVFSSKSISQADSTRKATDTIIVNKDPRLDILTQKQAIVNKRSQMMTSNGLYKGYRLQLLSTNNRNQAFKLKYDLLTNYPDHKSYVTYQAPYFKVRLGNFLKREDAEKMRKQLAKSFPSGVFLVEDAIEYTPKDDDDIK
jgi:hypothetical protein